MSRPSILLFCLVAGWLVGSPAPAPSEGVASAPEVAAHPHFKKRLVVRLGSDRPTLSLGYQTATFDAEGAREMAAGSAWHLAGATLELSAPLEIGGVAVPKGRHNLLARKEEDGGFRLVLAEGRGFSTKIDGKAHLLETRFRDDAPVMEHLSIDLHPSGNEDTPAVELIVRFASFEGRARIVAP